MSAPDVPGAARSTMLVLVVIEELADSRDGVLTLDEAVRGGLTLRTRPSLPAGGGAASAQS